MAKENLKFIVTSMCKALHNAPIKESDFAVLGEGLFKNLVENGYIDEKGFVTDKSYKLRSYCDLKIDPSYENNRVLIYYALQTQNDMVPQGITIDLREHELLCLIESMDKNEMELFCDAFFKFSLYLKIANRCRGVANLEDICTNFILITLFGLVEKIMVEKNILFGEYVEQNIGRCVSQHETEKLLKEWREVYGANRKVHSFFKSHILEKECEKIIAPLKDNPYFKKIALDKDPIKKLVDEIISWRSKFVHELGFGSASASGKKAYIMPDKNGILSSDNEKLYPAVGIDLLIYYVLLGFFRRFNKNGILTTIN